MKEDMRTDAVEMTEVERETEESEVE